MKSTLFFLMASLLLPPALGDEHPPEDYWTFLYGHTYYNDRHPFDCTGHLRFKQAFMSNCLSPSSVILGDTVDQTSWDDLLKICRGEGTDMGNKLFKSNAMFRVVKCRVKDPNARAPNCVYKPTFESAQIIVGCDRGYPVHFDDTA